MRKVIALLAPLVVAAALVAGCAHDPSSTESASASSSSVVLISSVARVSPTGVISVTAATCPTDNTKKFAKTRFAANVGIIAGSFHRYIYKPYKAGTFKKGAHKRLRTILKAGATALLIKHELGNAISNAKANPTLCKVVIAPLTKLRTTLGNLKKRILKGDTSSISDMNDQVSSITSGSSQNGVPITETS